MKLFKVQSTERLFRYFDNKAEAKAYRDSGMSWGTVVSRGPDHWKGESFNVAKQTPSSKGGRR